MTGALVAATTEAMQDFIQTNRDNPKYKIKIEILVNFRSKATDTDGHKEAHQLYAAPMDVILDAGNTPDTAVKFWDAARQTKSEIEYFFNEPHMIVDALDFFYVLGHHPISLPLLKVFSWSFKQGRQKAISVSNLGMTDKLYQRVGPWKLGRMQMGIDELIIGHSIFLAVASHEGRLNFTLSYVDPIVSRAMAEEYGQAIIRSLIAACPPPPSPASMVPESPVTPMSITAKPPAITAASLEQQQQQPPAEGSQQQPKKPHRAPAGGS